MKTKKPNAELVYKQIEDLLVSRLRLSSTDRAVYAHLLRHTRLEGKLRLRFSWPGSPAALAFAMARRAPLCAASSPEVLCASSNAAKPATSSRCFSPTRFTPRNSTRAELATN